ncbi:hypothetical protein PENTCL1PPCAC_17134, partial [Pristionchus entomophagus]
RNHYVFLPTIIHQLSMIWIISILALSATIIDVKGVIVGKESSITPVRAFFKEEYPTTLSRRFSSSSSRTRAGGWVARPRVTSERLRDQWRRQLQPLYFTTRRPLTKNINLTDLGERNGKNGM